MSFGPYLLVGVRVNQKSIILELSDDTGTTFYYPERFRKYGDEYVWIRKACELIGKQVVTETSNPEKNSPENWWISLRESGHASDKYFKFIPVDELNSGQKQSGATTSTVLSLEQLACIEGFKSGENMKISAFAGTGKTSTLIEIAKTRKATGLYTSFGRDNTLEAKSRFPDTTRCLTSHSIARREISKIYTDESKLNNDPTAYRVATELKLESIDFDNGRIYIDSRQLGQQVVWCLSNYCYSGDIAIEPKHVRAAAGFNRLATAEKAALRDYICELSKRAWRSMCSQKSGLPLGPTGYQKLWSLGDPVLDYDYIFLDEAQDSNGAVLSVLSKQSSQLVYAGDKYQQIYQWRGAVNAMDKVSFSKDFSLTKSFRFGENIASIANKTLRQFGEQRLIEGVRESSSSRLTQETIICRTNFGVLDAYLNERESGRVVKIVDDGQKIIQMLTAVLELQASKPTIHPDFFGFKSWAEVVNFSESEEGASYKTIVGIVKHHDPRRLKSDLESNIVSRTVPATLITTAHKSKGLEFLNVVISDDFIGKIEAIDFSRPTELDSLDGAELSLLYVAATRSIEKCSMPASIERMLDSMPKLQSETIEISKKDQATSVLKNDSRKPAATNGDLENKISMLNSKFRR